MKAGAKILIMTNVMLVSSISWGAVCSHFLPVGVGVWASFVGGLCIGIGCGQILVKWLGIGE